MTSPTTTDNGTPLGSAVELRCTGNPAVMLLVIERRGERLAEVTLSRKEISTLAGRLRKVADDLAAYEARLRQQGISKGAKALHDEIFAREGISLPDATITAAVNAWLNASNPVGEPETIYDDFYRLRGAARRYLAAGRGPQSPSGLDARARLEELVRDV